MSNHFEGVMANKGIVYLCDVFYMKKHNDIFVKIYSKLTLLGIKSKVILCAY